MSGPRRLRVTLLAAALSLALADARALGLGEPEVHSWIGAPLRIEVPLHLARGESVDEHCISLLPVVAANGDNAPVLPLQLRVVEGDRPRLVIESERVVREPFASVRVRVECGGAALSREFSVLLDPPPQQAGTLPSQADGAELPGGATRPLAASPSPVETPARTGTATTGGSPRDASPYAGPRAMAAARAAPPHLRLETGGLLARRLGTMPGGGEGMPVLRLDMHMEAPPPVTASVVAQRAQLRDLRALMLSGDDTLERLLALQTQVGTLETQLKSLQGGGAAPGAPAPIVPPLSPAAAVPAAGQPAPPTAATPGAPTGDGGVPSPAAVAAGTPSPAAAPAADTNAPATASPPPPPPQVKVAVRKPPPPPPAEDPFDWTLPAAAGGAALLLMGGALYLLRRRRLAAKAQSVAIEADEDALAELSGDAPSVTEVKGRRKSAATGGAIADPAQSAEQSARSAYLSQRFPEIAAGLIHLHDPDSVVNGARLYLETGDHDRAEELLEAAIHDSVSNDVRPWLGLFEVLRLRRNADAFAGLLGRFRERFATSRYLPEVLAAGRQIDPGRPEFAAPEGSAAPEIGPDGTSWLNPELDFVPQALAQDLHDTLMAELADDELSLSPMEDRRT